MPTLDMEGPYLLNDATIDKMVERRIGNYALGESRDNSFYPKYVGRSDEDINTRLHQWVGEKRNCPYFKMSYANNRKEAFEKECKNFHDFLSSLDNDIHPDKPDGTNWKCPVCGQ
jgi:hypothetical protein